MPNINLNFINRSNDTDNTRIVIFQQNVATTFNEAAIAWTVIEYCARGDNHPFVLPSGFTISATDAYGNETPQIMAESGQYWEMVTNESGDVLQLDPQQGSPNEVILANNLFRGSITANAYKDGKLLATKSNVSPQQKAVFEFQPKIWIGVVAEVEQGQVLNAAIIQSINTEISLLGISSADIVMTGGGSGSDIYQFSLENIVEI